MLSCVFRWHGEGGDLAVGRALADHLGEVARVEFAAVGAAEDPSARGEAGVGELDESVVVFFNAEDFAFVIAGEGGGIEDDAVEGAALAGEAFEPVEGVSFAEVVVVGVEIVGTEVFFGPVEIDLGEVEGGGGGSSIFAPEGGADGEGAGVGKGVEDGFS